MAVTAVDTGHRKVSRAAEVQAPAGELFDIVADPHRHGELDGSGTLMGTVGAPRRLAQGARFSVKMKQYGVPYRVTSRVTDFDDGHVVEWRHPLGHRWRWELTPSSGDSTRVMETFDYSRVGPSMPKHWSCSGTRSRTPRVSRQRCESCRRGIPAAKDLLPPPRNCSVPARPPSGLTVIPACTRCVLQDQATPAHSAQADIDKFLHPGTNVLVRGDG